MKDFKSNRIIFLSRYSVGVISLFLGVLLVFKSIFSGIFMMLFGISLLPIIYEKIDFKKFKYAQIILPSIFIMASGICFGFSSLPKEENVKIPPKVEIVSESENEKEDKDEKVEVTELNFNDDDIELDINDTKNVILDVFPNDANIENLECFTSDNKIAVLERIDSDENKDIFEFEIKPYREGECEVFVKSENEIESNKIHIKIIDNKEIQEEKNEIEEFVEKQTPKKIQNQEEKVESHVEEKTENESSSNTKKSGDKNASSSNSGESSNNKNNQKNNYNKENGVYRTPYGKRYHYDPECGGKNSYKITIEEAEKDGLTPCKKCVH